MPRTTPHTRRLHAFFDAMDSHSVHAAVLTHDDDLFYLTGFTGSESALLLDGRKRRAWIVTDSRYTEEAAKTAHGAQVAEYTGKMSQFIGKRLVKLGAKATAYTPRSVTVRVFDQMREAAPAVQWTDAGEWLNALRVVKDEAEVAAIRAALACAQAAFAACRTRWKPGMTETDVQTDLDHEMRLRGATDPSFPTIVAVGANASLPHAHPGTRRITPGKMLLIDFGARVNRYCSDLTRTLWAGDIPPVWRKRYEAVLRAQLAGIDAIAPGKQGRVPDKAARDVLAAAKLDEYFTHSLGHGVGLAVHEEPRLSRKAADKLPDGAVITVEPGIYIPGSGGIRTEDMVLARGDGCEVLSSLPKDIDSAVF